MAEKAVWEFRDKLTEEEKFDVVTINPGFILGPLLSNLLLVNLTVIFSKM